jgi:hypothetical protein
MILLQTLIILISDNDEVVKYRYNDLYGVYVMDISIESRELNRELIQAYGNWLHREIRADCDDCYYVNLMFERLNGPRAAIDAQMHDVIVNCFYPRLCKRLERHPGRPSRHRFLPRLLLFPDLPVFKTGKESPGGQLLNGGLHYNGILSISPWARRKDQLLHHIRTHHPYYAGNKIARIHLEPVSADPWRLMDYATKTVAHGYVDYDRGIFLPKSLNEMRPARPLDERTKALKDFQSATNLSDDLAKGIRPRAALSCHRSQNCKL